MVTSMQYMKAKNDSKTKITVKKGAIDYKLKTTRAQKDPDEVQRVYEKFYGDYKQNREIG